MRYPRAAWPTGRTRVHDLCTVARLGNLRASRTGSASRVASRLGVTFGDKPSSWLTRRIRRYGRRSPSAGTPSASRRSGQSARAAWSGVDSGLVALRVCDENMVAVGVHHRGAKPFRRRPRPGMAQVRGGRDASVRGRLGPGNPGEPDVRPARARRPGLRLAATGVPGHARARAWLLRTWPARAVPPRRTTRT